MQSALEGVSPASTAYVCLFIASYPLHVRVRYVCSMCDMSVERVGFAELVLRVSGMGERCWRT